MKTKCQIALGAALSYVAIAVNIVAGILYTPWMLEQIGQSQYGLYTLAQSVITLFLVDFGLGSAVSRYLSKYRAQGALEKEANFLGMIYKLYIIIDAVIFLALLVVFLFLEKIYVNLTTVELDQLRVVFVISGLFSVINFPFITLNGVLTAHEKFIQLKLADVIHRVIDVGMVIVALTLGYGLYALVVIHAASGLITTAFKWIVVSGLPNYKINFHYWDRNLAKNVAGFSVWVTVATLAQRLVFNISPSILGVVSNTAEIALFGVITTIEQYSYMITSAINGMFIPKLSRIYAGTEKETNITPLVLSVGKFQFALNGLIVVGFALLGTPFLRFWMGDAYVGIYAGILLVIAPGLFYNSLEIVNNAMIVQKKVDFQAKITLATGITNVILSFVFSYCFGAIGACLSICIAYCVRAVLMHIVAHKNMGVNVSCIIKQCYFRLGIPIIATLLLGLAVGVDRFCSNWAGLILTGLAITAVYAIGIILIGLTKDEKRQIVQKLSFLKNIR